MCVRRGGGGGFRLKNRLGVDRYLHIPLLKLNSYIILAESVSLFFSNPCLNCYFISEIGDCVNGTSVSLVNS